METLVNNSLETKLNNLKVNRTCPKDKPSIIVKNCKRPNKIQEYKCQEMVITLFLKKMLKIYLLRY